MSERALTIWKFVINPLNPVVMIPSWRELLTVQAQNDELCLWAEVDPSTPLRPLHLSVYGTGHQTPGVGERYIGTGQLMGGSLVLHVYRVMPGFEPQEQK